MDDNDLARSLCNIQRVAEGSLKYGTVPLQERVGPGARVLRHCHNAAAGAHQFVPIL